MANDADIIVVGGGCIGTTVAREMAADNDVLLFERDQIAAEATGQASGIVQPQYQFAHLPRAGRLIFQFYESLDGHRNYEYTERELVNLHGPEKTDVAKEFTEQISGGRGYDATWLSAEEIDERYPGIFNIGDDSPIAGGMLYGRMGWVDPYTFATTMADDAKDRGAEIRTGVEVTGVLAEDWSIAGVETDEGTFRAPTVVAAAGRRTRSLIEEHIEIPIQPERFWHINLEIGSVSDERIAEEYPQWYIDLDLSGDQDVEPDGFLDTFWRPEHNGELHIAGIEGLLSENPSVKKDVEEKFHQLLADTTPRILNEFDEAKVASEGCCPTGDAMSPDWLPIIDAPDDAPDGLVIATAFSGLGLTASPAAAAAVRELIDGHGAPFSLETFSLGRFEDRSADFPEPPFDVFDMEVFEFGEWRTR